MWSHMSPLGCRPFRALDHKHAKEFWAYLGDNSITKAKINRVYISVLDFPVDGLIPKVLFDRIREVAGLIGIITDK